MASDWSEPAFGPAALIRAEPAKPPRRGGERRGCCTGAEEVAVARDPVERGRHREVARPHVRRQLLAAQRRRNGRARLRPHGVQARDRPVLAMVDEHAAPLALSHSVVTSPGCRASRSRDAAPASSYVCSKRARRWTGASTSCSQRRSSSRSPAAPARRAARGSNARRRSRARSRPRSSGGSRSKTTKSGRSGLSTPPPTRSSTTWCPATRTYSSAQTTRTGARDALEVSYQFHGEQWGVAAACVMKSGPSSGPLDHVALFEVRLTVRRPRMLGSSKRSCWPQPWRPLCHSRRRSFR